MYVDANAHIQIQTAWSEWICGIKMQVSDIVVCPNTGIPPYGTLKSMFLAFTSELRFAHSRCVYVNECVTGTCLL